MRRDLRHLQFGSLLGLTCLTAALALPLGARAGAQVVGVPEPLTGPQVARATVGDTTPGRRPVADSGEAALRRMREGDLHVGDRVVLRVPGVLALNDTFVVRAGRVLELPDIPAIPLAGVARADLVHHLRLELARYVRDTAAVDARSLTRVSVVGEVNAPGYYAVAPDALVGDVLMRAGGLARTADPERMMVRRGPATLWRAEDLRKAVVAGQTLDELGFRAGDEIVVPARRDWGEYARTGALVASALVGVILVRQR